MLPDGQIIQIGDERFRCPEALFRPRDLVPLPTILPTPHPIRTTLCAPPASLCRGDKDPVESPTQMDALLASTIWKCGKRMPDSGKRVAEQAGSGGLSGFRDVRSLKQYSIGPTVARGRKCPRLRKEG